MIETKPRRSLSARLRRAWQLVIDRFPRHTPVLIARRLTAQANAARSASLYEVAAGLFEEALRFTPGNPRLHVQCGHMLKEAGHFASAEEHYRDADRLLPGDADLALQLGHFFRVSARPIEAAAAYRRALELNPGWIEAFNELARLANGGDEVMPQDQPAWIVPELLPRSASFMPRHGEQIRIVRLGSGRLRGHGGMLKVLRGVEAIRGYCISSSPITAMSILVDGMEVGREPMKVFDLWGTDDLRRKYVFNAWHDFTQVEPGRRELILRFVKESGKSRVHSEIVLIAPPEAENSSHRSDAVVTLEQSHSLSVEEQINDLPSVIRAAGRSSLPADVRTILVQRADQLGDLVCSVPALRRLRELFPKARIIGLLTGANADLGRSLGLFDEIVTIDFPEDPVSHRRVMSAERQNALRQTLAQFAIDLAVDLGEGSESRPLLLLSGAHFLYGFKERESPWLSAGFEMQARDPHNGLETIAPSRKLLAMVEALGAMRGGAAQATPRSTSSERLKSLGLAPDRAFVVLHTGARLAYSRWGGFGELAGMLLARTDLDIVVMADDPAEISAFPHSERLSKFAGRMAFEDFDAVLSACIGFVGNDSGPKHLAALRGAPVVSLHMARLNWSEWGQEIGGVIISRRVPCAGCAIGFNAEDCGKDYACITHIGVEEVYGALAAQLQAANLLGT